MLSLIPVLLAALAAGILLPVLLRKKLKKPVAVLIGVGAFLVVTAGGMLVYLNIHYSAEPAAVQAFAESDGVTVTETFSIGVVGLASVKEKAAAINGGLPLRSKSGPSTSDVP